MNRLRFRSALLIAASACPALLVSGAHAAEIFFKGTTTAAFGTPSGPPASVHTINGNTFSTGLFQFEPGNTNRYTVDGIDFSIAADTPFAVANLLYHNGETFLGTNVDSVPVLFTLDFSMPAEIGKQNFDFTFAFTFTPNSVTPISDPQNDDLLTALNVQATSSFIYDGKTYTLRLLGFGPSASSLTSVFRLPENGDTRSTLWAVIGAPIVVDPPAPAPVPLPAAGWAGMAFLGALAAGAWRRHRCAGRASSGC